MKASAVFTKSITKVEDLPENNHPQIAFVGRSNVGKSSLINHLVNQVGLARTSSTPGMTQTINLFEVGRRWYLVDLPGYGYAIKSEEKKAFFLKLITDYLQRAQFLKLVFLVIDTTVGPTELDDKMAKFLAAAKLPFAFILNKTDKPRQGVALKLTRLIEKTYPGVPYFLHALSDKRSRGTLIAAMEKVL